MSERPSTAVSDGRTDPPNLYRRPGSSKWYARVRIPPSADLRGSHLTRSLRTASKAEALRRLPQVVAELKAEIEAARRKPDGTLRSQQGDPSAAERAEADWWMARRIPLPGKPGLFTIPDEDEPAWDATIENMLGQPVGEEMGEHGSMRETYDPERERKVFALMGRVTGSRVPVGDHLDRYLAQEGVKASNLYRKKRAVSALGKWLEKEGLGDNVSAVTARVADAFADHLTEGGLATETVNSYLSALSAYWKWLHKRGIATGNPWRDQQRKKVDTSKNAEKRPFTDDEVKAFLSGTTTLTLHDMMRLAALTGMRLREITRLRVCDAEGGVFNIEDAKTKAGKRTVPIHPDLVALVARRSTGKAPEDYLLEELTAPASNPRRRGGKVGDRFTQYRRDLNLDDRMDGRRQANADFHSFRRWFVTKMEQADVMPHIISAVVGHEEGRPFLALRTYSGGPGVETQLRKAVEAVRLPEGAPVESPDGPRMGDWGRTKKEAA